MPHLQVYTASDISPLVKQRNHETKLGEKVIAGDYRQPQVKYVLLGLPEDIGVRANHGTGGTHTAWPSFLQAFLNIQSTASLSGDEVCILGALNFDDLLPSSTDGSVWALRKIVDLIDEKVGKLIETLSALGKLPIVIGGGHNNAYPILKGTSLGYAKAGFIPEPTINCINLDAHADFRLMEGRHSGNGFRYAFAENFLNRYAIVGLHRNYNAQSMIEEMAAESRIHYTFWEDIFLQKEMNFDEAISRAITFTKGQLCGIELDLDAIEGILSSASSPSGISTKQARRYLHRMGAEVEVAYLHLCEGAVELSNGKKDSSTGKLLAYLVSDFVRAHIGS